MSLFHVLRIGWHRVGNRRLRAVWGLGKNDIWAVGDDVWAVGE